MSDGNRLNDGNRMNKGSRTNDGSRLNIAIAGGSGLIGRHLAAFWLRKGHRIVLISRKTRSPESMASIFRPGPEPEEAYDAATSDKPAGTAEAGTIVCRTWEELRADPDMAGAVDAVVNLAGETINQRWTRGAKERILLSRLRATEMIAEWINRMPVKPEIVVNASAVGIYGTSLTDTFSDTSDQARNSAGRPADFLAEVVREWERAAEAIDGARIVKLRIGVVLAPDGGALLPMTLPYRLGVGGRIGHGRQWLSWIHIRDLIRIVDFCVNNRDISGPVNATAPAPVTNDEFERTLGRILGRPHFMPVPSFLFRLLFGEMSMLLLEGQRALPDKLIRHGFGFEYPALDQALAQLLKRNP